MTHRRWPFWIIIGILLLVFVYLIRAILLPFVLGIFIAYFLHPLVDRLEKRGAARGLATVGVLVGFFVSIVLLSLFIVPVIVSQCSDLIAALPGYVSDLEARYAPLASEVLGSVAPAKSLQSAAADISGIALKLVEEFIGGAFHSGLALLTLLSLVLITPVVTFYLLLDWNTIVARMDKLLPREHAVTIRGQLSVIDRTLAGFIRGQLTVCLILATYYAVALSIVGLKFGIVIGLVTGLLLIFPYIGSLLAMVTALAVAAAQFDNYGPVLAVLAVYLIGQPMEGYVITPKLVGEKVGLHPVWIIFGMLSGAALFGFVGILLAVPATAIIGVLIRFAVARYLQSDYYKGEPLIGLKP
ncbi:MAG: AI-2E family transporter [Pseudomonadota bacterium]|nr:AI-2E family transporter [Pseudomonadota bacterium]